MPNPVYVYNIYDLLLHFLDRMFYEPELSFFFTQLNGFNYCYVSQKIQLNITHCIQLNDQTVLFLTIQFSTSYFQQTFLMSRNSICPIDRTLSGATSLWTWKDWLWQSTPHSPKVQYCCLTIRLFVSYPSAVGVVYSPRQLDRWVTKELDEYKNILRDKTSTHPFIHVIKLWQEVGMLSLW